MIDAHVFAAPDGQKGFDCNQPLTADDCKKFLGAGYKFAVRYVPRVTRHELDLTPKEVDIILSSGLGLMPVQHVALEGWKPTGTLGGKYGTVAAQEAIACGIPAGVTLWCDLEGVAPKLKGVAPKVAAAAVIDFANRWQRSVSLGGFVAGLYVGWHPGLTAKELYAELRFASYWRAYNADVTPEVRGFQMKQTAMRGAADRVPGIDFEFDVNHTMADNLGGRAQILAVPPIPTIGG